MVSSIDPASLVVSWQPPSEISCNGTITSYVIQCARVGLDGNMIVNVANGTTLTISGLHACAEYSVIVAAVNTNGTGPFSKPVIATSGEDSELNYVAMYVRIQLHMYICVCTYMCNFINDCVKLIDTTNTFIVPSVPQALKVVAVTSNSVALQWKPPKYPNGDITQYSIEYDGTIIDKFGGDVSDTMTGTVEGLSPDTDYMFKMKAYTRVGPGPPVTSPVKTCKLLNTDTFNWVLNNYKLFLFKHDLLHFNVL